MYMLWINSDIDKFLTTTHTRILSSCQGFPALWASISRRRRSTGNPGIQGKLQSWALATNDATIWPKYGFLSSFHYIRRSNSIWHQGPHINNIPIDGQSLCNTVEPFAALFWAVGIVLATTPDPPRRPDITVLHHRTHSISLFGYTLLEKQSKFPRYNMKCRGKHDTIWNIPRSITFPHYISHCPKFLKLSLDILYYGV